MCAKGFKFVIRNERRQLHVRHLDNGTPLIIPAPLIRNDKDDVISWTSKITEYAQIGRIEDARQLFDNMPKRNVRSWTAMIAGYGQNGRMEDARKLFDKMPERNLITWNTLIAGYVENGKIEEACGLFDKIPERNVITWTTMITGCSQNGRIEYARDLFDKMPERNAISWNAMITGYIRNGQIDIARQLFDKMPNRNTVSWNSMITGYAQNGRIEDAYWLFNKMPEQNTVSWTAMISGYAQNGFSKEALCLFFKMQWAGKKANEYTFTSVIATCSSLLALEQGKLIHAHIIKNGFDSNAFVVSALVTMYSKCSDVDSACKLFDVSPEQNVALWTSMMTGYIQNGRIKDARMLFEKMSEKNVVSWTALITGYVQNGHAEEALKLFRQMRQTNIKLNQLTFSSAISACGDHAAVEQGQQIHAHVIRNGFESNVFIRSALIAMYAKCGNIDESFQLFSNIHERDVVSWNSMIAGYAHHGHGREALQLFEQMNQVGLKPNPITFVGVLSACSHEGLVDEGWHYFYSMARDHGILPEKDHYGCMVGILGRAGCLDEAYDFISKMPFEPDAVVWGALLGSCQIHQNMELGQLAAEHLLKLEPWNATTYVVLSNIYAAAGRWDDAENIRVARKDRGIRKNPGCSWIVVSKTVHKFFVGDRSHAQTEKIYATLERLAGQMQEVGYMPIKNLVPYNVEEVLNEHMLPYHSEKLAIAFGLISTSTGTPIRIFKNLRTCLDCHNATKFISIIASREIFVRDSTRFHHFKDGHCSCKDYW